MTLGELIDTLELADPALVLPLGFGNPHSYRGYYDELAFEPKEHVTVSEMLADARSAIARVYTGWKGGEFQMDENTDVWLAEVGCTGETLGPILLRFMLAGGA